MRLFRSAILGNLRKHLCASVLVIADSAAVLASVAAAHFLRYDHMPYHAIYREHVQDHLAGLPLVIILYIVIFAAFHLYRCAWRFAGLETLWSIVCANTVGLAGMIAIQMAISGSTFPRSVLVILWAASIVTVGGTRIVLRVLSIAHRNGWQALHRSRGELGRKRAVIIGAGDCGARTLRAVRQDPSLQYDIIGFLDDDPQKMGVYVSNIRVLGPIKIARELARKRAVDEVIVAIREVGQNGIHSCIMDCRKLNIPVKVVPHLRNVLNGSKAASLADFSVEDLLRRAPADTVVADVGQYLAGARVLVTGAGGSIGSELCRQIASYSPASLVLLGHGENSIHAVHQELIQAFPEICDRFECVIASTANQARINQVFKCHRPQVVFHAAAHKHVPMMESNEQEAANNNILGTYHVAAASGEHGVRRVVLVSTDKAADPSCVMGATKWLCEEIFRSAASLWTGTSYVAVRFGNVLGSRGSVVPIFHEQIRHGGPVLVTHPEMTRYFMTIPEAVRLVLEAGAVGKSGQLYVLDMGKPVKILDLATDMIHLCGLEPGVDIAVEFTGIRPGEKMHERLTSSSEIMEQSPWPGLSIVHRNEQFTPQEMLDTIGRIRHAVDYCNDAVVRNLLSTLVSRECVTHDSTSQREARDVETTQLKLES